MKKYKLEFLFPELAMLIIMTDYYLKNRAKGHYKDKKEESFFIGKSFSLNILNRACHLLGWCNVLKNNLNQYRQILREQEINND